MNIGRCKEFRILRNRDLYDQSVLHCRAYRETETWDPPKEVYETEYYNHGKVTNHQDKLYKLIPTPDIMLNRTVDGVEDIPSVGECSFPEARDKNNIWAIRGYTLTLWVEEMTDGLNYWRQVHDCQVVVDEKPHQSTATAKSDIYERIIFKDFNERCKELGRCDELGGSTTSIFWITFLIMMAFFAYSKYRRWKRNQQCVVCNRGLTWSRKRCFWCWLYDAEEFAPSIIDEMKVNDKLERGSYDNADRTIKERLMNLKFGMEKSLFGYTKDEVVQLDGDFRSMKGVRPMKKNRIQVIATTELGSELRKKENDSSRFDLDYQVKMKNKYAKIYAEEQNVYDGDAGIVVNDYVPDQEPLKLTNRRHDLFVPVADHPADKGADEMQIIDLNEDDDLNDEEDYEFDEMDKFAALAANAAVGQLTGVRTEPDKRNRKLSILGEEMEEDLADEEEGRGPETNSDEGSGGNGEGDNAMGTSDSDNAKNNNVGDPSRKTNLWKKVSNKLNEDNIDSHIEILTSDPANVKSLVRLGQLIFEKAEALHQSGKAKQAHQLFFVVALLLQRACKSMDNVEGFNILSSPDGANSKRKSIARAKDNDKTSDSRDGFPWRMLAICHMRTYLMHGVRGDFYHLECSKAAWVMALKNIKHASNPSNLVASASISQFLGDNELAFKNLNQTLDNFPKHEKISEITLQAALCAKVLRKYKESVKHMQRVLTLGIPHPYSALDAVFIMGRIYEDWSGEEEDKEQMCHKAYYKCFNSLKKERVLDEDEDFDNWINNPTTWCILAEKASAAGHYGLAADLFEQTIERVEEDNIMAPVLFELAKATYRIGNLIGAKEHLERATTYIGRKEGEHIYELLDDWQKNDKKMLALVNFPNKKFAERLLKLLPSDL